MPKPSTSKQENISLEGNVEAMERYKKGFNEIAKGGKLNPDNIIEAVEASKEDYTEEDIYDALQLMGKQNEALDFDSFVELMNNMKDPNFVIDAFTVLDRDKKGTVQDEELRYVLENFGPINGKNLTNDEIEEILNAGGYLKDGKINYKDFVYYWAEQ
jgi:Ca2+-binding EF-hand superfamily protein